MRDVAGAGGPSASRGAKKSLIEDGPGPSIEARRGGVVTPRVHTTLNSHTVSPAGGSVITSGAHHTRLPDYQRARFEVPSTHGHGFRARRARVR